MSCGFQACRCGTILGGTVRSHLFLHAFWLWCDLRSLRLPMIPAPHPPCRVFLLSVGWTYWLASDKQSTQEWCNVISDIPWQNNYNCGFSPELNLSSSPSLRGTQEKALGRGPHEWIGRKSKGPWRCSEVCLTCWWQPLKWTWVKTTRLSRSSPPPQKLRQSMFIVSSC